MKHHVIPAALAVLVAAAGVYALGFRDSAATTSSETASAPQTPGPSPALAALSASAGQPTGALPPGSTALLPPRASSSTPAIPRGVNYVPLADQQLPDEWKAHLQTAIKNLRETGSFNRGKVTHEFALLGPMSESLQKKGLKTLLGELAITATDLSTILGPSYVMVGADSQGTQMENKGALGFFQILRNVSGNQMIELSENQLDVLGGDGAMIPTEYLNDKMGDLPATLERLVDAQGAVLHNIQWAAKDRTFQLTAKNMETDEVRQVATAITQRFKAMAFDGWRQRYEYDPDNIAHRLARPESKDKGR